MADLYVDATGSGSNTSPYDTPAKATANLQTALEAASAGDTIYCYGTQTLTSGGTSRIYIRAGVNGPTCTPSTPLSIIGVNSSWEDDGTKFILDGADTNGAEGIHLYDLDNYIFKNIRVTRCSSHGVSGLLTSSNTYWENCEFDNNGSNGFTASNIGSGSMLFRCSAHHNDLGGFSTWAALLFCVSAFNTGQGVASYGNLCGCLIHNNGSHGLYYPSSTNALVVNCVIANNGGYGIYSTSTSSAGANFVGCRVTGNYLYGYTGSTIRIAQVTNSFFRDNDTEITGILRQYGTNIVGQGVNGYFNESSNDYTLTPQASMYATEITLPTLSAEPT